MLPSAQPRVAIVTAAAAAIALVVMCQTAAASGPETFCVHQSGSSCTSGSVDEGSDLQKALNDAAANPTSPGAGNVIAIGPGTFQPSGLSGFSYASSNPLQISGAGVGQTTLTNELHGNGAVIALGNSSSAETISISQLSIAIASEDGLSLTGGSADHISVALAANRTPTNVSVHLYGSTLKESNVAAAGSTTVMTQAGSNEIDDSTIGGVTAVAASANTTIHRAKLSGTETLSVESAPVYIDDSLLLASSTGIGVTDGSNEGSVNALNDTIVGTGIGVSVSSNNNGGADAQVVNSIVNGFPASFQNSSTNGGSATIEAVNDNRDGSFPQSAASETGRVIGNPDFVAAASGDYHLLWDSPLIDASSISALGASSTTDLDGNPRSVGWEHQATPVDLGAYEYQHRPPTAAASVSPQTAVAGSSFTFDGSASGDPDDGDALTYSWSFDDGGQATGARVDHVFTTSGSHSATLTVTDPTGLSVSKTVGVSVSAPAASPPAAGASSLEASGGVSVSGSIVSFKVECVGSSDCSGGSATETTTERVQGGKVLGLTAAHAAKRKVRKRTKVVASRQFAVAAGATATVTLTLNHGGRSPA